jgi:hypothetical protein
MLLSRQQEGTTSCLATNLVMDVSTAGGWEPQSLNSMLPTAPFFNNGPNSTATSLLPPVTTNRPQVSSSDQLITPSTMSWTMFTVTRTVTSLLTITLTSI